MASTLDYLLASKYETAQKKQAEAVQKAAARQAKKKSRFGGFMSAISPFAGLALTAGLNTLLPGAGFLAKGLMGAAGNYLGSQATEQLGKKLGYGPDKESDILASLQGAAGEKGDIGYGGFDAGAYAKEIGGAEDFYDQLEQSQRMGALKSGLTAGAGAYTEGAGMFGSSPTIGQQRGGGILGRYARKAGSFIDDNIMNQMPENIPSSQPINLQLQEGGVVPIPVRDGRDRQKGTINYYSLY